MTTAAARASSSVADGNSMLSLSLRQKVQVIIGAGIGLTVGFGPMFLAVAGIFLKPMASSFNWSRADISILPTIGLLGVAVGAPIMGYIADRVGWKRVTGVSVILFPMGMLALSLSPASHAWIITIALFSGVVGAATTAAGYVAILSLIFDARLGMAMGFAMIGIGVGVAGMPVLAGMLLEIMDWRQGYACFAAIALTLGLIANMAIFGAMPRVRSNAFANRGASRPVPNQATDWAEGLPLKQALVNWRFWLIGIVAFVVSGATLGAYIHMVAYVTDRGIAPMVGAKMAGLVGIGVAISRVATGFILDKVFAPAVAFMTIACGVLGFYLLTTDIVQSPWLFPLAPVLVGIASGAEGDIVPYLAKKYFGTKDLGSIYGLLFAIASIGNAAGPYLYGWTFDHIDSYLPIYNASAALCTIAAAAILLLGRYKFGLSARPSRSLGSL